MQKTKSEHETNIVIVFATHKTQNVLIHDASSRFLPMFQLIMSSDLKKIVSVHSTAFAKHTFAFRKMSSWRIRPIRALPALKRNDTKTYPFRHGLPRHISATALRRQDPCGQLANSARTRGFPTLTTRPGSAISAETTKNVHSC